MVWQLVALYNAAHPRPRKEAALPPPGERPQQATVPHQVWCVEVRYLVQIEGQWLYSILIFDGYSRSVSANLLYGFERFNL
jgi:hypothetical protein